MPTPAGTDSATQLDPPSLVPISSGLPKIPKPTAVQSDVVMHDMAFRPLTWGGMVSGCHAKPALEENNTASIPAAKQSDVVGHDAERRRLVPNGGISSVQD